ncbi:lipoyl(octanoyl) transferase LipB [Rhodococcus sp. NBC_00297]|uniref:lipoyl(octanoyl) transferase LipB n=1 Tax=Rhodococcus sp. NBC_00297 TaxID=2976005 RepID=UPI002E2C903A|nr:lipoyl(octanoyl) transferase LipB [Rhodococcus sp. NBC_00297]
MITRSARADSRPMLVRSLGTIDYLDALEIQREVAGRRAENVGADELLLLEHPAVFTAGRRTAPEDRPRDGTPVIDVDRGGKITWHGPGQLVGYPIVRLAEPVDVVRYVRLIEEALIAVCTDLGLEVGRIDGRSGVWLAAGEVRGARDSGPGWQPERKVAAIGVRVQRGVALHGFALNCNASLEGFGTIVPCGIADAGVTTLSDELGRDVTVDEVTPAVTQRILDALDGALPLAVHDLDRTPVAPTPRFTTVNFGG